MRELTEEEIKLLQTARGADAIIIDGKRRSVAEKLEFLGLVTYWPKTSGRLPRVVGGHEFRVSITSAGRKECLRLDRIAAPQRPSARTDAG